MPEIAQLIRDDHEQIRQQFYRFDRGTVSLEHRKQLVDGVLIDLHAHARMEERFLYPIASRLLGTAHAVDSGHEAHQAIRIYISQLARMDPADEEYDRTFMALRRLTERHMYEEERDLLPAVEQAAARRIDAADGLDTLALEMEARWPRFRRDAARVVRRARLAHLRRMPSYLADVASRLRYVARKNATT